MKQVVAEGKPWNFSGIVGGSWLVSVEGIMCRKCFRREAQGSVESLVYSFPRGIFGAFCQRMLGQNNFLPLLMDFPN